jgi:hypothetical protein
MGKKEKRKFRNRTFCQLDAALIESEAFLNLSGKAAMLCLIRFHQKAWKKRSSGKKRGSYKDLVITNNGEIVFTYAEAKELGIKSSQTFHRVKKELIEEKGFIDIADKGNWYNKEPDKFSISERWRKYRTDEYKETKMKRTLPEGIGFKKQKSL